MGGNQMTAFVIGIDGGGTSTRAALVGLDGKLLAIGQSGSSNIDDVGVAVAQENIDRAVAAAEAQAGIARQPAAAIFLGMAGVTSEDDREHIRQIARNLQLAPDPCIGVDHDCRAALAGGLSGRPGIVQIIGTGSSCYGRTVDGRSWMAGGRGHLVSDEGSGCWMGLQAIRAAVRAHDGRASDTPLLGGVLSALKIREIDDVLNRLYVVGISRAELAALAPMVVREAMAGDAAAQGIVAKGAEDVAELVEAVARRLDMLDAPEVCIVGGLLNTGPIILESYGTAILRRLPTAQVKTAEQAPVMGAAILALATAEQQGR
jgi:N-acetylglucosamine kinase-like BadF-type ATPase